LTSNPGTMEDTRKKSSESYPALSHTRVIQLIQQFLQEHDYNTTLAALQNESGIEYSTSELTKSGELMSMLTEHTELQLAMTEPPIDRREEEQLLAEGEGKFINNMDSSIEDLHSKAILSVRFSPSADEGHLMATASADTTIKTFNFEAKENVKTFTFHSAGVVALDFNPIESELLLSGSMDGSACLINVRDSTLIQRFKDHSKYVVRVCWHPNGTHFATCSYDHNVCVYKKEGDSFVLQKRLPFRANVEAIQFTPIGNKLLIAVREDNYIHSYDLQSQQDLKWNMNANMDDHVSFSALDLAVYPNSHYLLVATDKERVILFNTETERQMRNFYGSVNDSFSQPRVAWDHSGRYIYCTSQDNKIHTYEVASQRVIHKNAGHTAVIRDMCMHPTENLLATASFDRTVKLWNHKP
jgi:WD40 repeat protein